MGLPKIDLPVYKHYLTGIKQEVKYRAFTVKEQKILLHAKQSKEPEEIVDAINQVLGLCLLSDIDIESLPYFDIEDLFVRVRARSVSNIVDIPYKVKDTDERITVKLDLDQVKVTTLEGHDSKIMITDNVGIVLAYPSLKTLLLDESTDDLVLRSIKQVFTLDEVMTPSDFSREELEEFVDQFDVSTTKKIHDFFATMPRVRHEMNIKMKDGTEETLKFEGIQDLFT